MLERIYRIDELLAHRRFVTRKELESKLGISWATLKRDLSYMRDRLHAPIVFDRELGGYRFETTEQREGPQYELPGFWFSAEEIHALLTMQHLIANLDPGGLLGPHIEPLLSRLAGILGTAADSAEEIKRRIRIETVGARRFHLNHFQILGASLLRRKRLMIRYHARSNNEMVDREISPQRIIYYRDNWYLDSWCHLREGLRAFAVDSIHAADILDVEAIEVGQDVLDRELGSGYGIFSGGDLNWATLRFSPERSRWVEAEQWHPQQLGHIREDGTYEKKVPYADDREILMDILKYGGDCEVLAPSALIARVEEQLRLALSLYETTDPKG
jgi:predicted DNA-binding transcriptional regulator YafY